MNANLAIKKHIERIQTSTTGIQELCLIQRGLERECLRLDKDGVLAQTPHPQAIGSALCHPYITTDFSESLLEFVTPVFTDIQECVKFLTQVHQFTYQNIGDEKIWMNSMPCILPGITNIPIAQYGTSNIGQMKSIYRKGLSNRYGSPMQTISGIHYNFSVSDKLLSIIAGHDITQDQRSEMYLGLVRNFHRHCWIALYLFGASPAVCKSFLSSNTEHNLDVFDSVSYYGKDSTCLRMSDLGYRNEAQSKIKIDLTNVDSYITSLRDATEQSYPEYEKIGIKDEKGYKQLNTNLIQIENEYYTVIRPKQVTKPGEKPSTALQNRGIGYVEVRSVDINPNSPIGITAEQMRFLDTLLLFCLLEPSPAMSEIEKTEIPQNRNRMVNNGRKKDLTIISGGNEICAHKTMLETLEKLNPIAQLIDQAHDHDLHSGALSRQKLSATNTDQTPSALIIQEMRDQDESFFEYAMRKTLEHEQTLKQPLDETTHKQLTELAHISLTEQKQRETEDSLNLDEYLDAYFAETLG